MKHRAAAVSRKASGLAFETAADYNPPVGITGPVRLSQGGRKFVYA